MNENMRASYTAADGLPAKLLPSSRSVRRLLPVHIQWLPTNRCNLNCPWCSCANRDRNLQMPIGEALGVIESFASYGCRAVTITGGGEPLCHPDLPEMLRAFHEHSIEVGFVTNGLLLYRLKPEDLSLVTWCRISNADTRDFDESYCETLERAMKAGPTVDWAFSHVVGRTPNLPEIEKILDFAAEHNFTHVRLVADIIDAANVDLDPVREALKGKDDIVVYQSRNRPISASKCLIGYIKPVIGPDFKMYLCCGAQYAMKEMSLDMPDALCMGDARDLASIYGGERKVYHVPCERCYYLAYNQALLPLIEGINHRNFV